MLNFSTGNAKLGKATLIFSLPAGSTCPGALQCFSMAVADANGKRSIVDGKHTEFRCFAASSEVQYDAVYANRQANFKAIVEALKHGNCADLINTELQKARKKNTKLVRIHESGDFFSAAYLLSWVMVAQANPDLKFYCYSKNLPLFVGLQLPSNFYMTASYGGKFDYLIDEGVFTRYSKVFMTEADANAAGLVVDHDDSHCFEAAPFALLVHGTQPKGSDWGKAIRQRRKAGQFGGYRKATTAQAVPA
jgi:hypothetical protein